jgi:tRNA G26 N,N-dimethylase Trm1
VRLFYIQAQYHQTNANLRRVIANDLSSAAVETMHRNVQYNDVGHLVKVNEGDAWYVACLVTVHFATDNFKRFDVPAPE